MCVALLISTSKRDGAPAARRSRKGPSRSGSTALCHPWCPILSQDPRVGNFESGDILVEGGKISAVAASLGPLDAEVLDGTDRIALPGFVDTHRHSWQSLIRHVSTDWTLSQYFSGVRGVLGKSTSPRTCTPPT